MQKTPQAASTRNIANDKHPAFCFFDKAKQSLQHPLSSFARAIKHISFERSHSIFLMVSFVLPISLAACSTLNTAPATETITTDKATTADKPPVTETTTTDKAPSGKPDASSVVAFTAPTRGSAYITLSPTLNISGTAADGDGVKQVIWSTDKGGSGIASGTTSWRVKGIALQAGSNVITVTAHDMKGNATVAILNVTYDTSPRVSGSTQIPTPGGADLFRYPYLQSESATQIKVLWATNTTATGKLKYKKLTDKAWATVSSTKKTYTATKTGLAKNFTQHKVVLNSLTPGTKYVYSITQKGRVLARNVPFKTMPASSNPVNFVVFGDSGTEYSQPRDVRNAIIKKDRKGNLVYPHDFIIGVGDLAYYGGSFKEFNSRFFDQLSGKRDRGDGLNSILATRPFFGSLGNHEYADDDSGATLPTGYLESFSLPVMSGMPTKDAERYYSFDAGDTHFVIVDSMKFAGRNIRMNEMLSWLDTDLGNSSKKWKLVFFHHSIFSNGPHGTWGDMRENQLMKAKMVPILQNHGVQLVMFGHDHFYQRSKPLSVNSSGDIVRDANKNIIETNGIVYVCTGNGGASLADRNEQPSTPGSPLWRKQVNEYYEGYDFVAYRNGAPVLFDDPERGNDAPTTPVNRWGFTHVTATRNALTVTAYNYDGEIMDQFTINR